MNEGGFDRLAYREPRPSAAIIHTLGFFNRWWLLPHVLRLKRIDFPPADRARLRSAVRPGHAAFLAPNHPEYLTDWLLDKEISRLVSPRMAHWASFEIVNASPAAQWLWLRNNLIANAPGGSGRVYSVRWALEGHGVLLHPEGTPTWHGRRVDPLVPGVVEMAKECCESGSCPVHIVPIVWTLWFPRDVTAALDREMVHIERSLGFPSGPKRALERRFADLQRNVLSRSLERHGAVRRAAPEIADHEFFEVQRAHADRLLESLESKYGTAADDRPRRVHAVRRAIHARAREDAASARQDRALLAEAIRLEHFTREHYGGDTLTQEQIAETLKQNRLALVRGGWREALHAVMPVAVAARTVSIRVAEPIDVRGEFQANGDAREGVRRVLALLRERLQRELDGTLVECADRIDAFRRPNPFHSRG